MRKICLVILLSVLFSRVCVAAENTALIINLNKTLLLMKKAKHQYELRRKIFNAEMPYIQIIPEREEQIKKLTNIITRLGGVVENMDESKLVVDETDSIHDALLLDAGNEIQLIEMCNKILYRFDNAEAKKELGFVRDQAVVYFMMFDNISQMSMMALLRSNEMEQSRSMPPSADRPFENPEGTGPNPAK